jgi:hypothetical protein
MTTKPCSYHLWIWPAESGEPAGDSAAAANVDTVIGMASMGVAAHTGHWTLVGVLVRQFSLLHRLFSRSYVYRN